MKAPYLFLFLFCGLFSDLKAQNSILFSGEVTDTLNVPVAFANVLAVDTSSQEMAGFAVTDIDGQFKIRLGANKGYLLKITYVGYYPFEQVITPTETNEIPYRFPLSTQTTNLGEVEVVAEMPVTFSGDTISYKVEAFTQGNERKLEDVLEDLPGFQVEENGDIKVQGKKVTNVMIDGKKFFDGDSKLATKNIPAGVVNRVQVLQNFNDVSPLRNVNTSEQLALNIELKEDKKQIVFGDLTAGAGPSERYFGHANAFYYDEKTNINLIADGNNVGELAFTMQDYFRFSGGLVSLMDRNGSNFSTSSDQLGIPLAERNTAEALNNQLGAINLSLQPSNAFQISGFAIGSIVDNRLGSISNRTYVQEEGALEETFENATQVDNRSLLTKLVLQYTPNLDLHLNYQAFGRLANIRNASENNSSFSGLTNDINGIGAQTPWSFQHKLSAYKSFGEKDVMSLAINHKIQHQDPSYNLGATLQPFANLLPYTANESPFNIQQNRVIDTDNFEGVLDYYHVLNRNNHLRLSAGFNQNNQEYTASILEQLSEEELPFDSANLQNEIDYTFQDAFAGVSFRSKLGKLTWGPTLNLHYYDVAFSQIAGNDGFDKFLLLPTFKARYEIRRSQKVSFSYMRKANFMDVQRIAQNLVVNSYNSISFGNPELVNSVEDTYSLNYSNFNSFSFFNIYGGITYQRKVDDIQSSIAFANVERLNIPINVIPVNKNLNGYLNLEKRFDHFRLGLDSRWNFSEVNNQIGGFENVNTNFQQTYKGTFSTNIRKKLNVKLTHTITSNRYEGNAVSNTFINNETGINTKLIVFKGLTWGVNYAINSYENRALSTTSNFDLLDVELRYRKEGSPWEFGVQGMNVLDTRSIRRDSFSDNLISTYAYFFQQRYVLFTVMFDL
ncbi:MAG: carboxypeptidase-like regulatory domain-containing protein [Bacteroidota bacterium]